MDQFDSTIARITLSLREIRRASLFICVCEDPRLEDYTIQRLRTEVLSFAAYDEFIYSPSVLSLLASQRFSRDPDKRLVVSVIGLEALNRDDQSEAIRLLNLERNRLGLSGVALILWITRQLLRRISAEAADFFSWRTATFFIPEPPQWDRREAFLRRYYSAIRRTLADETPNLGFSNKAENRTKWLSIGRTFRREAPTRPPSHGDEAVGLQEVLAERRICILGAPGTGKSALLQAIVQSLVGGTDLPPGEVPQGLHGKVPVLIVASSFAHGLEREIRSVLEVGAPSERSDLPDILLSRGEIVLFIDGADESADIRSFSDEIGSFGNRYPDCNIVVTSRTSKDLNLPEREGWRRYLLNPLTESEVRRFLMLSLDQSTAEALLSQFRQHPSLKVFARSPDLLQLAAAVVAVEGRLPANRFALLSAATNLFLTWDRSRSLIGREGIPAPREVQQFLPQLAWIFQERQLRWMSRRDLTRVLLETKDRALFGSEELEAFIRNAMHYTSLFQVRGVDRDGEPLFGFSHRLFQEYFASVQFVRRWQIVGARALSEADDRNKWSSVISLASAGMTGRDADNLVLHLIDEWNVGRSFSSLLLAGSCIADGALLSDRSKMTVLLQLVTAYTEEVVPQSEDSVAWRADLEEVILAVGASNRELILETLKTDWLFDTQAAQRVMQLFLPHPSSVDDRHWSPERI